MIIDLGSKDPRNAGSCEFWVGKYPIPGYCGETAEMLRSRARPGSLGEEQ